MKVAYHSEYSHQLGRQMEYKIYGHSGKPLLVFPTSRGRFFQYEDFGMTDAISGFIESGQLQLWACDGIDGETFLAAGGNAHDRIRQHERYFEYLTREFIPGIKDLSRSSNNGYEHKLMVTGCSLGAFHAANIFFRYPWHFDSLIALSGIYSTDSFFGGYMDETIYFNSPIHYLANLSDESYLAAYRQSRITICCGQGNFEDQMLTDTLRIKDILEKKKVPAWVDIWGKDVNHDWDWWRKQIVYFLQAYFRR